MNILLCAFAFGPGKGSEPGAGWNFAVTLARAGHRVTVLTKPHAKDLVRSALDADRGLDNIEVVFVGESLPPKLVLSRGFLQVYYLLWQVLALSTARRLNKTHRFDIVHAVTTSGIRFPCFMGGLGVPFILGPLGGGEIMPAQARSGLRARHALTERLRDLATLMLRLDPFMNVTFRGADLIFVRTEDTGRAIGPRFRRKIRQSFGIAVEPESIVAAPRESDRGEDGTFNILFVARLVYWKGGHLVVEAFRRILDRAPEARLTVVGRGPELEPMRQLAERLGVSDRVTWRDDWISTEDLERLYERHQLLLFPSLHEAGGTVVLEALAKAMPVVCVAVGGPGQIVGQRFGASVNANAPTYVLADRLADAVVRLSSTPETYRAISRAAWEEARRRSWQTEVLAIYDAAFDLLDDKGRPVSAASLPHGQAVS